MFTPNGCSHRYICHAANSKAAPSLPALLSNEYKTINNKLANNNSADEASTCRYKKVNTEKKKIKGGEMNLSLSHTSDLRELLAAD